MRSMTRSIAIALAIVGLLVAACGEDEQSDILDVAAKVDTPEADTTTPYAEIVGGKDTVAPLDTVDEIVPEVAQEIAEEAAQPDTVPETVPVDTVEEIGPQPLVTCETDADCADGLDCTTDTCATQDDGSAQCVWTPTTGSCVINHVCRAEGEVHPSDPCRWCQTASAVYAWTPKGEGDTCDDGDACTEATTCQSGVCLGTDVLCDDGDPCTDDLCDPATGCVAEQSDDGVPCGDDTPCQVDFVCQEGACVGTEVVCDDGDPCTDDSCDPALGCMFGFNTAPCDDGDPCTEGDACLEGECVSGGAATCDDGNSCTIDVCDPDAGCYHLPTYNPCCTGAVSACDDGDPCTDDLCDPTTGACSYELNTAPCDDGNQCTESDACVEGACTGTEVVCDDGNVCTVGSCSPSVGCLFDPVDDGATCDDGLDCSTDDACLAGECVGNMDGCACTPVFQDGIKLDSLEIGMDDSEGESLDVDGDGANDNTLGALGAFANGPLADSVSGGSVMLLLELRDLAEGPFTMAVYNGSLDPADDTCDFMAATCSYLVDPAMVDSDTCDPLVSLPATLTGDQIVAGGPDTMMPFAIPLDETSTLDLVVYMVQVKGTVTVVDDNAVAFQGLLAGAVTESDLNTAIDSLPADTFDGLGMTPDQVKNLLAALAPNDIATTPGGALDAKSIGIKIGGIDGIIGGLAE